MKGIKWPQIKGNLGSKACIYECNLKWLAFLRPLFTLAINTRGKLCSFSLCVWLEMYHLGFLETCGPVHDEILSCLCGAQKLPSFSVAQSLSSGTWLHESLAGQISLHRTLMLCRGVLE